MDYGNLQKKSNSNKALPAEKTPLPKSAQQHKELRQAPLFMK